MLKGVFHPKNCLIKSIQTLKANSDKSKGCQNVPLVDWFCMEIKYDKKKSCNPFWDFNIRNFMQKKMRRIYLMIR